MVNGHQVRLTYSPKVFIPLTSLCRDRCGYCTFAQAPAKVPAPYMSIDRDRKTTRLNSSHGYQSRMPSSA